LAGTSIGGDVLKLFKKTFFSESFLPSLIAEKKNA
jgi:hypothetical protein